MNDPLKKIFENTNRVNLTSEERLSVRGHLVSFIKNHPATVQVRNDSSARQLGQMSWTDHLIYFLKIPMPIAISSLVIALALGGGVSFAAEHSLPGEILYPIKVSVNEEIRAAVAVSPKAKAEWETKRLERRLEEAEDLSAQGKLSAKTQIQLAHSIELHARSAQEQTEVLESKGDSDNSAEINSRIEVSLETHGNILMALSSAISSDEEDLDNNSRDTFKDEFRKLKTKIRIEQDKASGVRTEMETRIRAKANEEIKKSAERAMHSAENKIEEAEKTLKKQKTEAAVDAEAKFTLAQTAFAEGKAAFETQNYQESFSKFQASLRLAEEARILSRVSNALKLKLKLNLRKEEDEDKNGLRGEIETNRDANIEINGEKFKGRKEIEINIPNVNSLRVNINRDNDGTEKNEPGTSTSFNTNIRSENSGVHTISNTSVSGTASASIKSETSIKSESRIEIHSSNSSTDDND